MKVVINAKHGGFGLSDEAVEMCRRKRLNLSPRALMSQENEVRSSPILVAVVEALGSERASGECASLAVVEIPFDDVDGWEITDRDGKERVEENHGSWS